MIIKMSKVEVIGPKGLLQGVLSLIRESGVFQIEPAVTGFIDKLDEKEIRSYALDERTLLERLFLEDLRLKIDELVTFLPKTKVRRSYIEPLSIIDIIAGLIQKHISSCKVRFEKREELQRELLELRRYSVFMNALASLLKDAGETPDLDFIGLTIKEPAMVGHLREAISRITDWKFELQTDAAGDGTLVGLITVEKDISEKVKKSLSDEQIPELTFPASLSGLTFAEKLVFIKKKSSSLSEKIVGLNMEMERFSQRWVPIYEAIREWIDDRLSLLRTTASVFETRMCFFISGWMPYYQVEPLRKRLFETFSEEVTVEEKEMIEEDMERVPIILKNPPYFRPFELFTRVLPLPLYTSYDPTPFIGIFFPLFFGMILGDAGYGMSLSLLSVIVMKRYKQNTKVHDGAKILLISSIYACFFGVLYGEFFGDLPHRLLGLEPICIERRTAVIPMLYFTLSIGSVHILLGLFLGAVSAFRKKTKKEGVYKLLSILFVLSLIVVLASLFEVFPRPLARPVIVLMLFLVPILFLTGGLLAPLELLKSIGNIISYVRIMAIGLTSVLLAFVANRLAGQTGDILVGIIIAGLIHLLNIVLGVFSPTIHSLRLHYVEFFSKFIEHGGRKFEPLSK